MKECSLIICEGISDEKNDGVWLSCVPSLYVRVYREQTQEKQINGSSLIICEGISIIFFQKITSLGFPHYM